MHNTTGFTMHKKIAITSIQRNRNKYIAEWIAFHFAAGFNHLWVSIPTWFFCKTLVGNQITKLNRYIADNRQHNVIVLLTCRARN